MGGKGRASVEAFCYPSSCRRHPSSSPVGICAYCLRDRLLSLVCSDCGENRLSSCSCADISLRRSSPAAAVEVGSVGRMSFLIDNDIPLDNPCENEPRKSSASRLLRALFRLKETPASACSPSDSRASSASVDGVGDRVVWWKNGFFGGSGGECGGGGGGGDPVRCAGKRVFSLREGEFFRAGGDSEFIDFRFDSSGGIFSDGACRNSSVCGPESGGGDAGKGARVWRRWGFRTGATTFTAKKKKKEVKA